MFRKLLLFFKASWLCDLVSKISTGINAAIPVVDYVVEQVDGSAIGEKIVEVLTEVKKFLISVQDTVITIQEFACGEVPEPEALNKDIDSALADLKKITAELNS